MDIHCNKCGEPWETDCLHDIDGSYDDALKLFKQLGCGAFNECYNNRTNVECDRDPIVSDDHLEKIGILQGMVSHADDLAALSEDLL